MKTLGLILKDKQIIKKLTTKPAKINSSYEQAKQFGEYVGLNVFYVMKLFKLYGQQKVLNLQSWLKDMSNVDKKRYPGLVFWKLKSSELKKP